MNDKLAEELAKLVPSFHGMLWRLWCFCHIVNLISKIILGQFERSKKKDEDPEAAMQAAEAALRDLMDALLPDDAEDATGDGIDESAIDEWMDKQLALPRANRPPICPRLFELRRGPS